MPKKKMDKKELGDRFLPIKQSPEEDGAQSVQSDVANIVFFFF